MANEGAKEKFNQLPAYILDQLKVKDADCFPDPADYETVIDGCHKLRYDPEFIKMQQKKAVREHLLKNKENRTTNTTDKVAAANKSSRPSPAPAAYKYRLTHVDIATVKDFELPQLRKFYKQVHESEGFDIDENPKLSFAPGLYEKCMGLAQFALDQTFNKESNTEFKVSKIEKMNMKWGFPKTYYLTFTANDVAKAVGSDPAAEVAASADAASCKKTFQARVSDGITFGKRAAPEPKRVDLCRLKK